MRRRFRVGDRVVIAVSSRQVTPAGKVVDFLGYLGTVTGAAPNGRTVDVLIDKVEEMEAAGIRAGALFFGAEEIEHADPVTRLAELAE